ncbi:helix-turn-helix domain-containing protein, partial [Morganella morganii]
CRQIGKKLAGHPDPDSVLCDSIANGWQGIFPERTAGRKPAKPSTHFGFSDKNYESRSAAWVNGGKHV